MERLTLIKTFQAFNIGTASREHFDIPAFGKRSNHFNRGGREKFSNQTDYPLNEGKLPPIPVD